MSIKLKSETGTTKVAIGDTQKEFEFSYEYLADSNGTTVTLEELKTWMLGNGFVTELPGTVEMEKLRSESTSKGKVAEPRSIVRCLLTSIKDYNYLDARSACIDEANNTPDKHHATAIAELGKMFAHTKATDKQKRQAELAIKISTGLLPEELDAAIKELASLV
jgi:hypothetical protein